MFVVQTHNQLTCQLALMPMSIPWFSRSKRQIHRRATVLKRSETVSSAFQEIASQLNLDRLNVVQSQLSNLHLNTAKSIPKQWKQSFITNSFLEKCGQDIQLRSMSSILSFHSQGCHTASFLPTKFACSQQVRWFRTKRSTTDASQESLAEKVKAIFPKSLQHKKDIFGPGIDIEKLKNSEKLRLKLAFAEGYLAGNGKVPKSLRILKIMQGLLVVLLLFCAVLFMASSAGGSVFKIQISNQAEVNPQEIEVTFNDVKGCDEAKQELQEIVEFLKNPGKFSALGGKLPKGALLVGPPGTGKTLLARAVAGEAGVPFFHAAGSEFDEVLVGQGARRVRDLFAAAKNKAPCVIFIDEIDAVGGKRTNSVLHPYANQTINQLLSEMDGFQQTEGVIVLGATNRREDLDKALLRPGRFDVEVHVNLPDYTGRKEILELYLKKIQCKNIDIDVLARGTIGFTGADIENMVNQAALKAAIENSKFVSMKDLENARDKVIMGPARKSKIPDEEANEITAYHESGHAIVAYYTKDANPIHKVTIIPRGASLGHTAYIPKKELYHTRKSEMLASMDTMMGGRAAEEFVYGSDRVTSGAASDLKQATAIASHIVKECGMSDKVGLRTFDDGDKGALININDLSPNTTDLIDQEIKKLLSDSYERAKAIIKNHAKEHKLLAEALMKYETLEADDVNAILNPNKESVSA